MICLESLLENSSEKLLLIKITKEREKKQEKNSSTMSRVRQGADSVYRQGQASETKHSYATPLLGTGWVFLFVLLFFFAVVILVCLFVLDCFLETNLALQPRLT